MKVIDQTALDDAETISQLVGPQYRDMAFHGAYDGSDKFDKDLALWHPPLTSADQDVLPNKRTLDARSRDITRNDGFVQGGVDTHKDSIVGSMYMLNARPMEEVLDRPQGWADEFQEEVEAKFQLWADSDHKWPDAARRNDLTELIRLAVGVVAMGGEIFGTAEWITTRRREFRSAIQFIDPDRIMTPPERSADPNVKGGIKHDVYGAPISAFVRTRHPGEYFGLYTPDATAFKEVGFYKPWGRTQMFHIQEQKRVDQTRALSDLSAGIRELAISKKFRDVTLQNAVVNATYAATIESELPPEVAMTQIGGTAPNAVNEYTGAFLNAVSEYLGKSRRMEIDGVKVPHLFPGTKLNMQPAGTPGGVGQDFETSLLRHTARLLGISYEELTGDFSKTNYASFRGAMTMTWRHMQAKKKYVADRIANIIYRLWLEEAINNDQIETFRAREAGLLYTDGHQNLRFDAISRADWIGASRGQIDELKETQAAVLRIKYGLSTHEEELARLGKDWRRTYRQLERERKEREARGIVLQEDNSVNAASGTPRSTEDEDKTPEEENGNAD